MKSLLTVLLATLSTSVLASEILGSRLINERTGEIIAVQCLERESDQCIKFQYLYARSDNGEYRTISNPIQLDSIQRRLDERMRDQSSSNIFHSNRLFVLSERSGGSYMGFLDQGEEMQTGKGGFAVDIGRDMYARGDYQSDLEYGLQAAGATVGMGPLVAISVVGTAVLMAADIAILPIRGIDQLINGKHVVRGKNRRILKKVLKVQADILNGEEDINLKTNIWKKVFDGIKNNF